MTDTTTRHGDRPEDQDGIAYYEYIGSAEGLRAEEAGTYSEYDVEAFDEMNREAWMMPDLAAGPVERGDASEAEDVAQEVYIDAHRILLRWEPGARFTTWLYRAFNHCICS